ncbi:MAG: hypothetical protein ACI8XC_003484 [Gammaproteobacteria bacterium]|jgi:hypothetical protein
MSSDFMGNKQTSRNYASTIPFPSDYPDGYELLEDALVYDPKRHLQLEQPEQIWLLKDFGYGEDQIAKCASPVAVSSPFRLLSYEGSDALHQVAQTLKAQSTHIEGSRVPKHLAGGVYRSKFLRDLCSCPYILRHMSEIAQTDLVPHSMPSQQLYINYAPEDVSKAVDAWHFDGIGFDYVIMVSDPTTMKGGNFEYFQGTREEIAELFQMQVHQVRYGIAEELPAHRVIKTEFPAAGYAIFQQGNMVVHRAARLLEPADRITIVPGLVALDTTVEDPTAKHDMPDYGEPGIYAELGRHSAWLAKEKLDALIGQMAIDSSSDAVREALQQAVVDVTDTLNYLGKEKSGS